MALGIDAEFGQASRNFNECPVGNVPGMDNNTYMDSLLKIGPNGDVFDTINAAWPDKPVFFQFTGLGKERVDGLMSTLYPSPFSLKQATLSADENNQWQSNGNGTLQIMSRYSQTTNIGWENAYAYTGAGARGLQVRYFTLLAGLQAFPNFMDLIGGWIIDPATYQAGILSFVQPYLGRTIVDTEDVWVALRDTDFWPPTAGAVGYGGQHDDFTYGMSRVGTANNPVIKNNQMAAAPYALPATALNHIYGLLARRTDNASGNSTMSFAADSRWGYNNQIAKSQNPATGAWYDLAIKYVDLGTDTLSLSYMGADGLTKTQTIAKANSRTWVTTTLILNDAVWRHGLAQGADVILSSDPQNGGLDEIVHMVQIKGHSGAGPTPTPLFSPTVRPTRTPTNTPISTTPSATPGPPNVNFSELRVNAGGDTYVDHSGFTWVPDQPYTAGAWGYYASGSMGIYSDTIPISNTLDPAIYQSERWFGRTSVASYLFDVPNGDYQVELMFAELLNKVPGQRMFTIQLQGATIESNFDIVALAGNYTALNRVYTATVSNTQLNITIIPVSEGSKISGIRVTRSTHRRPRRRSHPAAPR